MHLAHYAVARTAQHAVLYSSLCHRRHRARLRQFGLHLYQLLLGNAAGTMHLGNAPIGIFRLSQRGARSLTGIYRTRTIHAQ